jgi:hypothetical protein
MVESPNKRERVSSRTPNYLPPVSRSSTNIFDGEHPTHRRSNSGNSTTSSLSAGGFSLSSYEALKGMLNSIQYRQIKYICIYNSTKLTPATM